MLSHPFKMQNAFTYAFMLILLAFGV